MVFVGIDVGGTKTRILVIDLGSGLATVTEGEGANPAVVGESCPSIISRLLSRALREAGASPSDVEIVGIGSAGVGKGYWRELFEKGVAEAGVDPRKMELFEDFRTAYTSCFLSRPGIVAISGTGSSIYGECRGTEVRVGGWGHLLDDEGSAYQVGRDGMAAALRYYDGRGRQTALLDEMLRYLDIDSPELVVPRVYGSPNPKKVVAGFAPRVVAAAERGDSVASAVLEKYVDELARAIAAAYTRLREACGEGSDIGISIVGGFWRFVERLLRSEISRRLLELVGSVDIVERCVDPACGALMRALIARGRGSDASRVRELCTEKGLLW
ncbi:MAG: hypothetical protein GXO32_04255 [Crenarchaeota archaeon]|nr:hypothetical protein [Thermoproteota archaeon]